MKPPSSSLALGLLSSSALTAAVRLPFQRRTTIHAGSISGISGTPDSSTTLLSAGTGASNDSDITNSNNVFYSTNLTMGGMEVPLQLDTGSADLWVYPEAYPGIFANIHNFSDVPVGVRYGKGSVDGHLAVTKVSFAGFDVDDQAFIAVTAAKDMDALFKRGAYGIIGLGADDLSRVNEAVQNKYNATWGRTLLSNLFLQEPNTPNHVAFALDRAGDLDDTATGSFDIGEIQPQYAAIEQSSPIPLWPETANRWTVLIDSLTANGSSVPLNSTFEGDNGIEPPAGKSLALLDTGTSLALIPKWAVDAIYGSIPGSAYSAQDDVWFVPCMAEGVVSFVIGGITIPIHPLDLTIPQTYIKSSGEKVTYCVNTFRPFTLDFNAFDFLLGDSFLRNVYAVYDFGDFDSSGNMGKPYVKLLPLTDPTAASAGFKKSRAAALSQLPPEGSFDGLVGVSVPTPNSSVAGSGIGSGKSGSNLAAAGLSDDDTSSIKDSLSQLTKFAPIVLALLGVNAILLIGLVTMGAFTLFRRNKSNKTVAGASSGTRGAYAPVIKFPEDDDRSHTPTGRYDTPQYT
ncbi:aspartyl protease [Ceratobasidium sp. AG-Ba]|nr:aspartyl protease [Ceratobasidium sp. AG-Ba]